MTEEKYDLCGDPVELLPHIGMQFVSQKENGCAYFERSVLHSVLGKLPGAGNQQQYPRELWEAIKRVRFRWLLNASALSQVGLGGAGRATWNTRVNCRPVMVDVTPGSRACGFIRLCPFCYARKCWREYSHLRGVLFPEDSGSEVSNRRIICSTRRFHFHANTPAELEAVIFQRLQELRAVRDGAKSQHRLKALKGWFRNQKTWVKKLADGRYRFVIEIMLLGSSLGEKGVPSSAFLTPDKDPPDRKSDGLVYAWTWYDPAMTERSFRKWMVRSMRYRPELLSNDIATAMAYNRPMLELKAQQFYGGGEFRWRTQSAASSEEDFEESSDTDE